MYCTVVIHQDVELGCVTIHNTFEDALDYATRYCVNNKVESTKDKIKDELDKKISYCSPDKEFTIYIGSVIDKRKVAD